MKISKTLYIRYLFALLLPLSGLLQACDMIEYHPYDLDIDGETEVNARNIQRIETALDGKKEFSFAVISDTQRWYDETEDAVADMNEKGGIDFVVHTGDLSDFGMKLEFENAPVDIPPKTALARFFLGKSLESQRLFLPLHRQSSPSLFTMLKSCEAFFVYAPLRTDGPTAFAKRHGFLGI